MAAPPSIASRTPPSLAELRRSQLYSEELGIRLLRKEDPEYFKWFLASLLFGARISETIAKRTYRAFARHRLLTPRRILGAGWDFLVNPVMREGGYVRYDGRKSTQILRDCEALLRDYRGSLTRLHEAATDSADLEARVSGFYGVGPVTTNVFLRELRPVWPKADPDPLPIVRERARGAAIDLSRFGRHTLAFARIEAGLIRLRHAKEPGTRRRRTWGDRARRASATADGPAARGARRRADRGRAAGLARSRPRRPSDRRSRAR